MTTPLLRRGRFKKLLSLSAVHAALIAVSVAIVAPMLWMGLTAFKDSIEMFKDPFGLPVVWHWDNFPKAWFQGRFNAYFLNTVLVTLPAVAGGVCLSSLCGYALGKMSFPGRSFLTGVVVAGLAIPLYSIVIPLWFVLRAFGLVENLRGVVVAQIGTGLPFGIMLMRAFFLGVDKSYADSARVDGCNEFVTFSRVVLPLAKPAVLALIIFEFQSSWNAFLLPLLITHDESKRVLNIGLMFFRSRYDTEYGLLAAGVMIATIPIVIVYLAFSRYFVEGISAGGLKE